MPRGAIPVALSLLAALSSAAPARADVDLARLVATERSTLPRVFGRSVSVIAELGPGESAPAGFVRIGTTREGTVLGTLDLGVSELSGVARAHPLLRLGWAPPKRLLLDRADGFTRASSFRNVTGRTGRGVVVGILDTGLDPTHPDLRGPSGTRVRWWLDFSRERLDLQPELESDLGCRADEDDESRSPCAVLEGNDVDILLANGAPADDPGDPIGHGTHVASLAAGNGTSSSPPRFVGVAPEATLIVARVTRRGGGIFDADVLKAARFVFDRAAELGMPAVLNLSLGGDTGGHDGTSGLERGLSSLVGPEHPGRAIVVAAGNSAGLFAGVVTGVPDPLGIHTEVHVPNGGSALVPIVVPETSPGRTDGQIFAWVGTRAGDALSVAVEDRSGSVTPLVTPGNFAVVERGDVEITILNQLSVPGGGVPRGSTGVQVVIDGSFPSTESWGLRFEGPGTASVWVEGSGALSPTVSIGPLVPRALKAKTVSIPASAPELIAVGATLNRTDWVDHAGEDVVFAQHGALDLAPVDTTAFFSGAGPAATGAIKPDLVAPGAQVIGALSRAADPRGAGRNGLFDLHDQCSQAGLAPSCFVVDDLHAVTSGTSMAAPLVAGAVALLFEADPSLDQDRVRALLQAGSRPLAGAIFSAEQVGPGALDLDGTLEAQHAESGIGTARDPGARSRLVLADSLAHPDEGWPLAGLAILRDDAGHVADGFDESGLTLAVDGGTVPGLVRVAPGLYRFAVTTPSGSGGRELALSLRYDGRAIAARRVPIAVDPTLANAVPSAFGGCAVVAAPPGISSVGFLCWLPVIVGALRIARRSSASKSRGSPPVTRPRRSRLRERHRPNRLR
jgi:subtilisin family serine protease